MAAFQETLERIHARNPQRETILITALLTLFLAFVAFDLLSQVRGETDVDVTLPGVASPYTADLTITKLKYDKVAHALVGDLLYELSGNKSVDSIDRAALSLQQSMVRVAGGRQEPRRSWEQFPSRNGSFLPIEDVSGPALQITGPVNLKVEEGRRESYYPFDSYVLVLTPRGCANADVPCLPGSQVAIRKVGISFDQSEFSLVTDQSGTAGELRYVVKRPFFVRWVSVWLAAFSLVFLVYLLSVRDPRKLLGEALGFFAAIWALRSLVVPDTVKLFPTIIDYYTLSLFGMLFINVSVRVVFARGRAKHI